MKTDGLYWMTPEETETGYAGEQPVKGYSGQAHQTMRLVLTDKWRGVHYDASPPRKRSSDDSPVMPKKRNQDINNQTRSPRTRVPKPSLR